MTPERRRPSVSEATAEKLRSVVAYIKERNRGERFNMDMWFQRDMDNPRCGTSCCFAGFAAEMNNLGPDPADANQKNIWCLLLPSGKHQDVAGWAQSYFGLTGVQADDLFLESHWPVKFRLAARMTPDEKVARLAQRVEHFIADGD